MNYYRILGVPIDSSQDQIQSRYLQLMEQFKPEQGKQKKFREIKAAFDVLGQSHVRRKYNDARELLQSLTWSNGFQGVKATNNIGEDDIWSCFGYESHSAYWNAY